MKWWVLTTVLAVAAGDNYTARGGDLLWSGDPYLEAARRDCGQGSFLSCFRLRLLSGLDGFFRKETIRLNDNLRLTRMPQSQLVLLAREPYEFDYTEVGRSRGWGLSEAFGFISRRVERFLKSTALEVTYSSADTEGGRYEPRFIDEIYSELDTIDYKHQKPQKKNELKKLFIPLLIILKLFKLKLLLLLPVILGLASFKKFLGFLALAVPAVIGYFKLCKPDLSHSYGNFGHSIFYKRPPHHYYSEKVSYDSGNQAQGSNYYSQPGAQEMAYSSYNNYRR